MVWGGNTCASQDIFGSFINYVSWVSIRLCMLHFQSTTTQNSDVARKPGFPSDEGAFGTPPGFVDIVGLGYKKG